MSYSQMPWAGGADEPLLRTKLFVPRVRLGYVARPRVVALIDLGLSRKLTLVSAPAGSGKTTLLGEWCETRTGRATPLAWVSLEEADNHPYRFWLYLGEALSRLCPGRLDGVRRMLCGPQPAPLEMAVRLLINQIADLEQDSMLVLDDYHTITSEEIHQSVALLLEQMPPHLHLVMITRTDPPFSLTRLRARGELVEVRLRELRFTPDEAAAFCRQAMGLHLSDRQIALLEERTEGWVAGLQLAALSLEGTQDADRFLEALAGSHQYILDYLVEEVLQVQPERMQRFLLQTSILERISGPLCDAVTGGSDGQTLLELLERRNLFVIALDHQRHWYRYHHLFAQALRERLARERPEELPQLHQAASLWHEQQGLTEPAVNHALAAADYDRAVQLVAGTADQIWHRGDSGILMDWLNRLPGDLIRSRPDLSFSLGLAYATAGRPDLGESLLQAAEENPAAQLPEAAELLGKILASRANVARVQRNLPAALAYSQRALDLLPSASCEWRGWAVCNLGAVHQWCGELAEALTQYAEAKRLFRSANEIYGFLRATVWHVEVQADVGNLPAAMAEAASALALAEGEAGANLPVVSLAHLGVGEMLYEQYDLDGAEQHLRRCLDLSRSGGLLDVLWLACMPLALVKQGQGEPDAALSYLDMADQLSPRVPWALATGAAARAALLQLQGKSGQAARLAPQVESLARDPSAPFERAARTLATLKLEQGFAEEALAILEPLAHKPGGTSIRVLALLAVALRASGQGERALATLEQALQMAAPGGQIAPFMELDRSMADLLSLGAHRWKGEMAIFARTLLGRFGKGYGAHAQPKAGAQLIDPLSDREMEVLALLAEGASNEAIARQLFITLHTAKKHVANILGKLSASNRTQAVAKARDLGIL